MKNCVKCKYFISAKKFNNINECYNPKIRGILYLNIASECKYYNEK